MAEVERRTTAVQAAQAGTDIDSLPSLFGRLGDDVMTLVDTKLSLMKVELKEDASVYARNGAMIAVGGVVAAIGFVLVNVGVGCFVALLFASDTPGAVVQKFGPSSYGLGFLITGAVYLVIGGIIAYMAKSRLAKFNPSPETSLEEFRKDKQWLKKEI
ncbi:MAG: phage holin family protein [Acidobacteria bacterium]|nr:phage holin family protein [Acidobacteriota bacterium]